MDISEQIREIEFQAWRELGEKRKRERESEREAEVRESLKS
jgi:hypothetical protein